MRLHATELLDRKCPKTVPHPACAAGRRSFRAPPSIRKVVGFLPDRERSETNWHEILIDAEVVLML